MCAARAPRALLLVAFLCFANLCDIAAQPAGSPEPSPAALNVAKSVIVVGTLTAISGSSRKRKASDTPEPPAEAEDTPEDTPEAEDTPDTPDTPRSEDANACAASAAEQRSQGVSVFVEGMT